MMATQTNESPARPRRAEPSAKLTIDAIAKLLDLPAWDDVDERNRDHYAEVASAAVRFQADHASNLDEQADADERYLDAEIAVQGEVYAKWHGAILAAAEIFLGYHGLELVPVKDGQGTPSEPYTFRVVPAKSWADAADMIRETISGVGLLTFRTLREFLASGPYTARRAVLAHLGWIRRYPEVYASSSPMRLYESAWR